MQKRRARWAAWLVPGTAPLVLGLLAPLPSGAQAPVPAGGEFQVNTFTTGGQSEPSVGVDADGDFVVVWTAYVGLPPSDFSGRSIHGQRYASTGAAQGAQFQVNTYTTGDQDHSSVSVDADGDFVVVWDSVGSSGGDTSSTSIQGQRYASNGSTQGAQFQVNTYTTSGQSRPSIALDVDGDFIVVWEGEPGSNVQGRRYASNGSAQGAQFQVNTYTTSGQGRPSIALDVDGDFIVAWESGGSPGTDTSNGSVQGQRYTSGGSALGAQFQINTYTTNTQAFASVAADSDGDFVVVWESYGSPGTDTGFISHYSIQGQRYASSGSAVGAQFQVNTYTTNPQRHPSVTSDADGDFVVTWHGAGSYGTDSGNGTYSTQGQRYASNGLAQGAEFQVNTYTTSHQGDSSVAAEAGGDFVVTWQSNGSFGTDTSITSIQGQRYSLPAPPGPPPVPAMSPATRFGVAAVLLLGAAYALRRRA